MASISSWDQRSCPDRLHTNTHFGCGQNLEYFPALGCKLRQRPRHVFVPVVDVPYAGQVGLLLPVRQGLCFPVWFDSCVVSEPGLPDDAVVSFLQTQLGYCVFYPVARNGFFSLVVVAIRPDAVSLRLAASRTCDILPDLHASLLLRETNSTRYVVSAQNPGIFHRPRSTTGMPLLSCRYGGTGTVFG